MTNKDLIEYVNCNLCGSDDTKTMYVKADHIGDKKIFNIVQCKKCGLVYVNPRHNLKAARERYSREWFKGGAYRDYMSAENELKNKFRRKIKVIEKYKKSGRLLDIGCAAGFFMEVAKESNWETFGVEISEYASNYARERGLNVLTGDLAEIDFPDEYFDVITMWEVIANLTDPRKNLIEAHRILKKDGLIVISTGNINSIFARFHGINWEILSPGGHLYYFSQKTIGKMLKRTGFEIFRRSTHGNITQNKRVRNMTIYRYVNAPIVKYLRLGDVMTVYALKT